MAVYWISFTLDDRTIGGRTYNDRWTALYTAVHDVSTNWWEETTAFIAFETEESIVRLISVIKSAVSEKYDIVIIRKLDTKIARIIGPVKNKKVFTLIPYLKRG